MNDSFEHLPPDLQEVADALVAHRDEADGHLLERVQRRVLAARPPRLRRPAVGFRPRSRLATVLAVFCAINVTGAVALACTTGSIPTNIPISQIINSFNNWTSGGGQSASDDVYCPDEHKYWSMSSSKYDDYEKECCPTKPSSGGNGGYGWSSTNTTSKGNDECCPDKSSSTSNKSPMTTGGTQNSCCPPQQSSGGWKWADMSTSKSGQSCCPTGTKTDSVTANGKTTTTTSCCPTGTQSMTSTSGNTCCPSSNMGYMSDGHGGTTQSCCPNGTQSTGAGAGKVTCCPDGSKSMTTTSGNSCCPSSNMGYMSDGHGGTTQSCCPNGSQSTGAGAGKVTCCPDGSKSMTTTSGNSCCPSSNIGYMSDGKGGTSQSCCPNGTKTDSVSSYGKTTTTTSCCPDGSKSTAYGSGNVCCPDTSKSSTYGTTTTNPQKGCCPNGTKIGFRWHYSANTGGSNWSSGSWSSTSTNTYGSSWSVPGSMEGSLKVSPGTSLKVGYSLSVTGNGSPVSFTVTNPSVVFQVKCVIGSPTAGTFTATIPSQAFAFSDGSWYPSSTQSSSASYEGSVTVPNLCKNGQLLLSQGGTFSASVS